MATLADSRLASERRGNIFPPSAPRVAKGPSSAAIGDIGGKKPLTWWWPSSAAGMPMQSP